MHIGDIQINPVSDGTFVARPAYFGDHVPPHAHPELFSRQQIDSDTIIAPGITAVRAPGHTPGHMCVVVASGSDRALLLGDAVTCPVQLGEPTWHSMSDVDPALANRTRQRLWRELEDGDTVGVGAHFPELQFGRVLTGAGRQWFT